MNQLIKPLWQDEHGVIVSAELAVIGSDRCWSLDSSPG